MSVRTVISYPAKRGGGVTDEFQNAVFSTAEIGETGHLDLFSQNFHSLCPIVRGAIEGRGVTTVIHHHVENGKIILDLLGVIILHRCLSVQILIGG